MTKSILPSEFGGGDVEDFAVFGDGAAGDVAHAGGGQFGADLIVVEGVGLVFVVDDFFEFGLDGVVAALLAVVIFQAAAEKAAQRQDSLRALNILARDGP